MGLRGQVTKAAPPPDGVGHAGRESAAAWPTALFPVRKRKKSAANVWQLRLSSV